MIFFLAGYETTANTICFCVYELALNPDKQHLLREEVDRVYDQCKVALMNCERTFCL